VKILFELESVGWPFGNLYFVAVVAAFIGEVLSEEPSEIPNRSRPCVGERAEMVVIREASFAIRRKAWVTVLCSRSDDVGVMKSTSQPARTMLPMFSYRAQPGKDQAT